MSQDLTLVLVLVAALGIGAQWIAWRLRVPAIVLFSIAGLIAGPMMGWVSPSTDFGPMLDPIISLCVAIILFEGGLSLHWHELKQASSGVKRLISISTVLVFLICSLCAYSIGGLSMEVSLIFGAILVVTGPTVIMPLLRQSHLNRRTASYLKWEGIINDPIGALLAVLVYQFLTYSGGGDAIDQVVVGVGWGVLGAIALGGGAALFLGRSFQRVLIPEYLKVPITLVLVLIVFVLGNAIEHEAGLLAVTVMGLVMGNMELPGMEEMRRFKESITIMLVATVFVLLTADLQPEVLLHLNWQHAALVGFVLFFVRPASVFLATLFTDMGWKDRLLVSWIGPRGIVAAAVAGVFGTRLAEYEVADAELLVPLVFAVIFATVICHGFTIGRMAKWLGLSTNPHGVLIVGASPWTTELARTLKEDNGVSVLLLDSSWHRLREARLAGVPVIYGEILSEPVQQSLQLNGIACLLAATSNDYYNALVCRNFAASLEHDSVFQLPMYSGDDSAAHKSLAREHRGIAAFNDSAQYEELWRRHHQNWKFYKTRITDSYDHEDFLRDCPAEAMMIAILKEDGELRFHSPLSSSSPRSGDTIIYYAPRKSDGEMKTRSKTAKTA